MSNTSGPGRNLQVELTRVQAQVVEMQSQIDALTAEREASMRVTRVLSGLASGLPGWSDKHPQEVLDWARQEVEKDTQNG